MLAPLWDGRRRSQAPRTLLSRASTDRTATAQPSPRRPSPPRPLAPGATCARDPRRPQAPACPPEDSPHRTLLRGRASSRASRRIYVGASQPLPGPSVANHAVSAVPAWARHVRRAGPGRCCFDGHGRSGLKGAEVSCDPRAPLDGGGPVILDKAQQARATYALSASSRPALAEWRTSCRRCRTGFARRGASPRVLPFRLQLRRTGGGSTSLSGCSGFDGDISGACRSIARSGARRRTITGRWRWGSPTTALLG